VAPPDVPAAVLRTPGREAELALLAARRSTSPPAREVPPALACIRVGPIADGQVAELLRSRLVEAGFSPELGSEDGQVWVGYWVQLEPVATREEADQIVARLAAGGLPDAYVLQTTAPFGVSLGVFRERERADLVAAAAAGLGFRAQMADRYRPGLEYWLTMAPKTGQPLSLESLGQEIGQILRAEPTACPAAG
jgi:cell division protein FtsN